MLRQIEPEWLDELPVDDAGAVGSRRDLQRLNAWMGNARTMARALRAAFPENPPRRLAELGAGDGTFLWQVARLLPGWRGTTAVLIDRQSLVSEQTRAGFDRVGWAIELVKADAMEWVSQAKTPAPEAMVANLFLHHFAEAQLSGLLSCAARQSRVFVAIEPRRSALALLCSRLVRVIGCNEVTRHDAPISVRAGFAGGELSRLWPVDGGWSMHERRAGLFSHLLVARRV
jgi:hypothetical protein